ncbi:DNA-binding LacI/PurR family transcriptional regulator/ABC-type glycerol-3-phosphate transport system substrate-binding protein [Pantoea alhagi]|uniref:extracellular solute-binding protein n=1 Tax=Mixta sp. BE291 TaxID=3158787 RepID=UPI0028557522|nr:DNA-binding LacI/PurR family transcriptional regulator/ABC-type glycerol-3-phosphate transport system substrate-binding protein [Pantoea alhagi]
MTTIKDIARLAGVSHGTVSNVLNLRGNVSAAKISAVKAAAKQLGYQANAQAKSLRQGGAKTIALIVPDMISERYQLLYSGLNQQLLKQGYVLELFLTEDLEENEKKQLEVLATRQCQGVVIVSCFDDVMPYYNNLSLAPEKIIFIYRKPRHAKTFYDIDMSEGAKHFSDIIKTKKYTNVGVFTDLLSFYSVKKFKDNLELTLNNNENINVYWNATRTRESHKDAFDFLQYPAIDAIICTDFEKVKHVRNAWYLGRTDNCPPIYTFSSEELRFEPGLYCYPIGYKKSGTDIAEILISGRQPIAHHEPVILDHLRNYQESSAGTDKEINLLTIDSPSSTALKKLLPHFYRMTGIRAKVTCAPFDELIKITENEKQVAGYDLFRVDMATFPRLAKDLFEPLNNLDETLSTCLNNIPANIVNRYSRVDDVFYAIPFDPSVQMLFYRRDLFEDQKIKRLYFERFKRDMQLPESYEEFDRLAAFFSRLRQSGEINMTGTCATIGGAEMIATEFLQRYYARGGRLLHEKSPPCLNKEIALPALKNYIESLGYARCLNSTWWQDSVAQFEQRELAMLIVYMNLFTDVAHSEISPLIGYAPVPGGAPLLGGGSVGISKYSKNKEQAMLFLQWLFSPTIVEQTGLLGGGSAYINNSCSTGITDFYPWSTLCKQCFDAGIRENHAQNGYYFDLHQVEYIIGKNILDVIHHDSELIACVAEINRKLALL